MLQLVSLLRSRSTLVWAVLVLLTLASWTIGAEDSLAAHLATVLVLVIAFVKVRWVGLWFMELRRAPLALRLAFEGYCLVVCVVLIVLSFISFH